MKEYGDEETKNLPWFGDGGNMRGSRNQKVAQNLVKHILVLEFLKSEKL